MVPGMPVLFPNGVVMSFELLGYGMATGLIHKLFMILSSQGQNFC